MKEAQHDANYSQVLLVLYAVAKPNTGGSRQPAYRHLSPSSPAHIHLLL
jgi:hypothetical protein